MLASDNSSELSSIRLRLKLSQILRLLLVLVAPLIVVMARPRLGLARETMDFSEPVPPGTIVINTLQRKLFFVLGEGSAIRYPIAVPKNGNEWSGAATVNGKYFNPDWVPPPCVKADHHELPDLIPGGVLLEEDCESTTAARCGGRGEGDENPASR